jgi:hypothetical protein
MGGLPAVLRRLEQPHQAGVPRRLDTPLGQHPELLGLFRGRLELGGDRFDAVDRAADCFVGLGLRRQ